MDDPEFNHFTRIVRVVSWYPTTNLRYVMKRIPISDNDSKSELRLQQLWQDTDGGQKWEWVEEVEE